jgi:hypothetical protein
LCAVFDVNVTIVCAIVDGVDRSATRKDPPMKKLATLGVAAVLALTLAACGDDDDDGGDDGGDATTPAAATAPEGT